MYKRKLNERHKNTIKSALMDAQAEQIWKYIDSVYLFGSCARHEQRFDSDADLLFVF